MNLHVQYFQRDSILSLFRLVLVAVLAPVAAIIIPIVVRRHILQGAVDDPRKEYAHQVAVLLIFLKTSWPSEPMIFHPSLQNQ